LQRIIVPLDQSNCDLITPGLIRG